MIVQGALPHNPLVTHETDVRHLRDPAFLRGALRYRVARLLFTLQLRLRNQRAKVGDFYAWNACLSHILALANVSLVAQSVHQSCSNVGYPYVLQGRQFALPAEAQVAGAMV